MKIKVTTHELKGSPFVIQTPGMKGVWENVEFFINDKECVECDHWIIMHEISKKETCLCPPQNVWLFMEEPSSIHIYEQKFLNQFSNIVTSQDLSGKFNVFHEQQSIRWFYGWDAVQGNYTETYDSLSSQSFPSKERLISVISSTKQQCPGHIKRLEFTKCARDAINADTFGWGLNSFSCKRDTILPYKYQIVIENTAIDDYWTEKLADCYLGWAFPIYYGCTNLEKYFDRRSFFYIDITDTEKAKKEVKNFILNHDYEASKVYIEQARKKILNKYNFFPNAARLCRENNVCGTKMEITLYPEIQKKTVKPDNPIKAAVKKKYPEFYRSFSNKLEEVKKLNKFRKKYRIHAASAQKDMSFWEERD